MENLIVYTVSVVVITMFFVILTIKEDIKDIKEKRNNRRVSMIYKK